MTVALRPSAPHPLPLRNRPLTAPAASSGGFTYQPMHLPALAAAQGWTPGQAGLTGTDANVRITATYHALDQAMSRYLGAPAIPNWMTFGKYASREAGSQIVRLEELLRITSRGEPDALVDTVQDFLANPAMLGEQGLALAKLSKNPADALRNAKLIRDALVIGNTGVYADVGPAYDLFLRTEAAGGDGVAALRDAGWGRAPRDPQGLLLPAFALYQRAHREAQTLTAAERTALVHRANMLIVSHEQIVVVQGPQVFGDARVAHLMGSLTGQMTVTDVRGTQALLPNGGNWADFATRMGFVDAAPGAAGAFVITTGDGARHHYVINPDAAKRRGTIGTYFAGALGQADARRMIAAAPRALPPAFQDGSDLGRLGRRWFSGWLAGLGLAARQALVRAARQAF